MALFPTTEPRFSWPGATPVIPSIAPDRRLIEQGRHDELMALRGTDFELSRFRAARTPTTRIPAPA